MSKQYFTTDIKEIESLKRDIQEAINKKVEGNGDCLFLQRQIEERCGFRIANNTLRRVFGLLPASPPSKATLDILSEFLGYSGWDGFLGKKKYYSFKIDAQQFLLSIAQKEKINKEELNTVLLSTNNLHDQLVFLREVILIATNKTDIQFLSGLFKLQLPFEKIQIDNFDFSYLISIVAFEIRKNKTLRETIIPIWSEDSNAHRLYFEFFVDIDYLIHHHDWVLNEYLSRKKTKEAMVFVNSLLFLKNWLSKDYANCEVQFNRLTELHLSLNPLDIHGIPYLRLLAYRYLWASYTSNDSIKVAMQEEIKAYIVNMLSSNNQSLIVQLIHGYHNLGEILIWLGEYNFQLELYALFSECLVQYKNYSILWNYDKIHTINAYCYLKIGKKEVAKKIFEKIQGYSSLFQRDFDKVHYLIYKYEMDNRKDIRLLEEAKSTATSLKMDFLVDWIEKVRLG